MVQLVGLGWSQRRVLKLVGIAASTWHYRHRPRPAVPQPRRHKDRQYPNRITTAERDRILARLREGFAAQQSVYACWYDALDAGEPIASLKTWYRIAATHLAAQRPIRRTKQRRAAAMPQFEATAAGQVWCWDITKLPGKYKGQWYSLYLVIDVFSRYVVGWRVEERENDELAAAMFRQAFIDHGTTPQIVHSDGGASMMSETLAQLYRSVGITRSRNRPRVSNDNPFVESWFKTAKYGPDQPPSWFPDLTQARAWARHTIQSYNTSHHHSSLEGHTPQSVHNGTWSTTHQRWQHTLDALAAAHPQRYRHQPQLRTPATEVGLNTGQSHNHQRLQSA